MKKQIEDVTEFLKNSDVDGCITGSTLLEYFPDGNQDVDVFCYSENSFTKCLYTLYFSKMFLLLEPIEEWKFKDYLEHNKSSVKKFGLVSVKFKYNTSIDVNVIFKKTATSIFSVLSSFDINIICKGWDIKTKQELDLTGNPGKIADWNKWNTTFYNPSIWEIPRLLRQFERCIKYHKRGYNTDAVILKYREILEDLLKYHNIFNSETVESHLERMKESSKILIKIFDKWLESHSITEEEEKILKEKTKDL